MRRKPAALLLLLVSLLLLTRQAYAQAKTETQGGSAVTEITVPIGKTVDSFTYSDSGLLSYKGNPFSPAVEVRPDSVQAFRISLPKDKGLAGAIAEDIDGQNSAYLLDLGTQTSTPLQEAGTWSAARQVFWSPSGRYMLALCAYEGHRFIGIDLQTKEVINGDFLGPEGKRWVITNEPRWAKGADALVFTVNETCNPYDETDCDPEQVLAKYAISLNPATLTAVDARSLEVRPAEDAAPPPQLADLDRTQIEPAETSVPEASAPPLPSVGLVRTTSRLNLRECPAVEGCGVIRTLAAGIDLEVLGQQEEWLQVRDAATGDSGWVHSGYTMGVAAPPSEAPSLLSRITSVHPAIAMLLLAFPFLIGMGVWLIKPASALTRMDAWNSWLLHRRERASSSTGFFGKYWGRPVFGLSGLLVRWTEQIGDPFLRCGTRVALFLYFTAFVLISTILLAYLAVVIVIVIIAIIVTLWITAKLLSSDEDDSPRRSSHGREQVSQEEDEEERRRELLLRAGARGSTVFQKTGVFVEDERGRVDEHGRIYRKTGVFSEEQVGRIDEEGRVFTKTGPFSEEEVGRIAEDGCVFEKSGLFSEDRIGRIDEDGRIYRRTGSFSEEEIGRADGKT